MQSSSYPLQAAHCSPLETFLQDLQRNSGSCAIHLQTDNAKGYAQIFNNPPAAPADIDDSSKTMRWASSPPSRPSTAKTVQAPLQRKRPPSPSSTDENISTKGSTIPVGGGRGAVKNVCDFPVVRPRRRLSGDPYLTSLSGDYDGATIYRQAAPGRRTAE